MRILHVIPQFPYFGGRTIVGGHASALLTLAAAQAARGDDVEILSYVEGRGGTIEIGEGLRVHSLFDSARPGSVRYGLRFRRAALARVTSGEHGAADVVHGHSGFVEYMLVTAAIRRRLGRPAVHTLYCPVPRQGGRARRPLVHAFLRHRARSLDARAAMSENVARSMRAYGMGAVEVVPPPVDVERFRPDPDPSDVRRELGVPNDAVVVLFVGNAKPQKNLEGVLRAFHRVHARHPSARLVVTTELAQSSSDERLAHLRRMVVDLDLESVAVQKGIVHDMPGLMQACDVLVAPFLDSFGPSDYFMAALEAMACGKPVVVSAVGGMPEVVADDRGRLVDPHDDDALAGAIEAFVADPALRRAAGANARTYTERHFDPRRVAERYRTLYERIAS